MSKKSVIHHVGKFALIAAILGVAVFGIGFWKRQALVATYVDATKPTPPPASVVTTTETKTREGLSTPVAKAVLPAAFNLAVPFVKQAPLGVWDAVHEETCEEASVLTVYSYIKKISLSDGDVDTQLLQMVALEKKLFGFFEDTDVAKTIEFAKKQYPSLKARILEKPTLDDIKKELYAGRPVLMPADGKALNNPNFRGGGPVYHLIVLRGWNPQGFFVNDPGTKKGENYFYTNAVIDASMHDWNEAEKTANGPRRAFVLYE